MPTGPVSSDAMITWMLLEGDPREIAEKAMAKAWTGGAGVIAIVTLGGKPDKTISIAWSEGARARRPARWPDVLGDWAEIHDEKLFPGDAVPVLAEEASGLGADALVIHGEPGLGHCTTGWYAKGAVALYERVSGASVAWAPNQPLGRPFDGKTSSALAWGGRKLAELVGSERDATLFQRMEATNKAYGEALVDRALWRLFDRKPPPLDELAGIVANAPQRRLTLP